MEAGHATLLGKRRGACVGLVGKHEGKSPLGRPRSNFKIILKLSLKEQNFEGTFRWCDSECGVLEGFCKPCNVASDSTKLGDISDDLGALLASLEGLCST